jgi:lipopolysaccharide transport system ATP-binding protein
MSDIALGMAHIYKMFRKGEVFNSLRDLIPALTGRMFRQDQLSGKDQREFWALHDLSFEVKRGEAFGLIGHNGAGKSTALKILTRLMRPTQGRMFVHGRLSALIEVTAGFHQDLTGRENIFLHGTILGMTRREIQSKLDQIVAFSGLEEFIDTPVKRYSSGMYARLGFSIAAHVNPEVMVVDEVLSVGDFVFQRKCVERMKEVIHSGAAVVFVSHNLKTIAEFCQTCLLLDRGQTVATGPTHEVISTYLTRSRKQSGEHSAEKPVRISRVTVRGDSGECLRFRSGDQAWIDIEVTAAQPCARLSVSLYITDEHFQGIFNISTERLGHGNFSLAEGERYTCTFELALNLANGIFHPCVVVYRYDSQTEYDEWRPAATIYVACTDDIRGVVNCFPKVTAQQILRAQRPGDCSSDSAQTGSTGSRPVPA